MSTPHYYDVDIVWVENRKGVVSSSVLPTTIEVATPPEFPQGMPGIWSPEHFLVAATNSCLMTTFLAIAEASKLDFVSFQSKGKGKLEQVDGKFMVSEIELTPTVVIADDMHEEKALRILHKSEAACLISNSLKSTIVFNPIVRVQTTES
jgi:organic hydroperoxide reductase OsmC/OhrA